VSATKTESPGISALRYGIPDNSPWAGAWKVVGAVGVAGLVVAAYGYTTDPARFPFSYLFAFFVALSLALGSLFFVTVLHVTKAAWGVTVRRTAEQFMRPMPIFAILVIPLVLMLPQLFPWESSHPSEKPKQEQIAAAQERSPVKEAREAIEGKEASSPLEQARGLAQYEPQAMRDMPLANVRKMEKAAEGAEVKIVAHKRFYLNRRFFLVRLLAYLLVWSWLARRYFRWSTDQDRTRAAENTAAAQRFAPPALILFGVTLTFFAFDWLLSLDATWYSTIFGVQIFAQCALFQMASLIVVTLMMRKSGLLGDAVNVEHYHDMGKLLFGWIVFWSYISFAQFFLYWYSNIPDELVWYHKRWGDNGGTWMGVSVALVLFHFFVPFWFLMSRNVKRRVGLLSIGAWCMIVMHVVEVYWVVMPNYGRLDPSWVDLACLVGVFGVYLAAVLRGMGEFALVPVGDPRLVRALTFENA
jgi:hypothetical protein